jgi:hypothetical protein
MIIVGLKIIIVLLKKNDGSKVTVISELFIPKIV